MGEEITEGNFAISPVTDFNPLLYTASKPLGQWYRGPRACSSLITLNLHFGSQRQVCLTYEKPNLSGMQLSWQSKEIENLYKLKISCLVCISYFFFQRDALFLPEDLCLDCTSRFFPLPLKPAFFSSSQEKGFGSLEHKRNIIFTCLMKMMTQKVK